MFTDYERRQADVIILFAILAHLAEEGDFSEISKAEKGLDDADLAYFSNKIVQKVMAE